MKVELKLNADTINAAARLLEQVYDLPAPLGQNDKIIRSIAYDVADAMLSKQKTIRKKINLFDAKKKYKTSLKYHEAFALYNILNELLVNVSDDYTRIILDKLK
ncbi:hypothetical protein LIT53_12255, partial [Flavobacterium psychrophilum]